MDIDDIFPKGLALADALDLLRPLTVYILGMTVYAIFIFKFHQFVASRDIFKFDVSKYEQSKIKAVRVLLHAILYVGKYIILFPVIAFFWFVILTLMLSFLARDQSFSGILLTSMAVVGAIRAASYYNENLSRDLAKILPFAVLGIFIINLSFFKVAQSFDILKQADAQRESILYYLAFLIAWEFFLRISSHISHINPAKRAVFSTICARCSRISEHSDHHEC